MTGPAFDELIREGAGRYRYICYGTCNYRTRVVPRAEAELVRRVHRHRHGRGLAGLYHRREPPEPEPNEADDTPAQRTRGGRSPP